MGKISKTKNLSKAEKACIDGLLANGFDSKQIAKTLDREVELVEKHIVRLSEELEQDEAIEPQEEKPNLFITKTEGKRQKGVAIMTEAASTRSDATRPVRINQMPDHSFIHQIKKKK